MSQKRLSKPLSIFLVLTILFCLTVTSSYSQDLDGDGKIGVADAIYALQVVTKSPEANRTRIDILPNGTPEENGSELLRVLSEISDASASNKYVLKLFPGTYNLVDDYLQMKEYVDIEGFTPLNTIIISSNSSSMLTENSSTVAGADNSSLQNLTVQNNGGHQNSIGIFNLGVSPTLENINVIVTGGPDVMYGICNRSQSKTVIRNALVTINGLGTGNITGIINSESNITIQNVQIAVSDGTYNTGVYNNTSDPYMESVAVNVSGAVIGRGIQNYTGSPTMVNISSTVTDSSQQSAAIYNYLYSNPTIRGLYTQAPSDSRSAGVKNEHYSHTIIEDSYISGKDQSINNFLESSITISHSVLDGRVISSGISCDDIYNSSYQELSADCLTTK